MSRNAGKDINTNLASGTPTDEVIDIFTRINDRHTMSLFFEEIFTSTEIKDIALRWRLMKMLSEGIPQRRVADQLGISLCKITRGARVLKKTDSVSRSFLERVGSNKKVKTKTIAIAETKIKTEARNRTGNKKI